MHTEHTGKTKLGAAEVTVTLEFYCCRRPSPLNDEDDFTSAVPMRVDCVQVEDREFTGSNAENQWIVLRYCFPVETSNLIMQLRDAAILEYNCKRKEDV